MSIFFINLVIVFVSGKCLGIVGQNLTIPVFIQDEKCRREISEGFTSLTTANQIVLEFHNESSDLEFVKKMVTSYHEFGKNHPLVAVKMKTTMDLRWMQREIGTTTIAIDKENDNLNEMMAFFIWQTAGWDKVALVVDVAHDFDMLQSRDLVNSIAKFNTSVSIFSTDEIESLKESNLRIVVMQISSSQLISKFLSDLHQSGIPGNNKYRFISLGPLPTKTKFHPDRFLWVERNFNCQNVAKHALEIVQGKSNQSINESKSINIFGYRNDSPFIFYSIYRENSSLPLILEEFGTPKGYPESFKPSELTKTGQLEFLQITIQIIAILLISTQIFMLKFVLNHQQKLKFSILTQITGLLMLETAAILFSNPMGRLNTVMCYFRYVVSSHGFALFHGVLAFKLYHLRKHLDNTFFNTELEQSSMPKVQTIFMTRFKRKVTTTKITPNFILQAPNQLQLKMRRYKHGKIVTSPNDLTGAFNKDGQIVLLSFLFMLSCSSIATTWYLIDPVRQIDIISNQGRYYDVAKDAFVTNYIHICHSQWMIFWIFGFCMALGGIIGWALWLVFRINQKYSIDKLTDVKLSIAALTNSAFAFSGCAVTYFVAMGSLFQDFIIAFFFTAYTVTSTLILLWDKFNSVWKFVKNKWQVGLIGRV